jgi:hypothetical protein
MNIMMMKHNNGCLHTSNGTTSISNSNNKLLLKIPKGPVVHLQAPIIGFRLGSQGRKEKNKKGEGGAAGEQPPPLQILRTYQNTAESELETKLSSSRLASSRGLLTIAIF